MAKRKQRGRIKTPDEAFYGEEPIALGVITDRNDINLGKALNWYNYMYGVDKGKTWLLMYMKKENYSQDLINGVKSAPNWKTPTTVCWLARILLNGNKLPQGSIDWMNEKIRENAAAGAPTQDKEDKPKVVVDIQARMRELAQQHICEFEGMIDLVIENPKHKVDAYTYLVSNQISKQAATMIRDYYVPHLAELKEDCDQIREGYGNRLSGWIKFYEEFLQDFDRYIDNKKRTSVRKPRKPKEKLAVDIVKRLNYQKDSNELKLVSIPPTDLVGADQVWVYNTKYKAMTVYYTDKREGISVKGTTLINFDPEKSVCKKLRKPEEGIKTVLGGGKIVLKKFMDTLNTKVIVPNGRINEHTILLRAIK